MREERIKSLEKVEASDGEVRVLANAGDLALVFPRELWEAAREMSSLQEEPPPEELSELEALEKGLLEHAGEHSFETVLTDVPFGGPAGDDSSGGYDLVLRSASPLAATTGYVFLPVIRPEHVALFGARIDEDGFVEGAYLVGAVAEEAALLAGDEGVRVLSVRGRRCSSSRFELVPELWQVLSEKLGWRDVEPADSLPGADSYGNHRKRG